MLTNVGLVLLANFIFLFLFWKRLKEDYVPTQIFTTAFYVIAGVVMGIVLSIQIIPSWWFWVGLLGVITALALGIYRFRMRASEVSEAGVISLLPVFLIFLIREVVINASSALNYYTIAVFLLIILFFIFDAHYKKFTWYKSGRVGFSGFTILGIFFLVRTLIAMRFPFMLSFSGNYDIYLSGVSAFASFLTVFHLARKT